MATRIVYDLVQISCPECHAMIDQKTWRRHMRRVHAYNDQEIKTAECFTRISRPFHEERD